MKTKDDVVIKELQEKLRAAQEAFNAYELERNQWVRKQKDEIEKQAKDMFGEKLNRLSIEKGRLEQALQDEVDAEREKDSLAKLPYPEGTIMYRKMDKELPWSFIANPMESITKGILQIFREGDPEHDRKSYWHRSPVGSAIVRKILKNGKIGKTYVLFNTTKEYWETEEEHLKRTQAL